MSHTPQNSNFTYNEIAGSGSNFADVNPSPDDELHTESAALCLVRNLFRNFHFDAVFRTPAQSGVGKWTLANMRNGAHQQHRNPYKQATTPERSVGLTVDAVSESQPGLVQRL